MKSVKQTFAVFVATIVLFGAARIMSQQPCTSTVVPETISGPGMCTYLRHRILRQAMERPATHAYSRRRLMPSAQKAPELSLCRREVRDQIASCGASGHVACQRRPAANLLLA